MKNKREKNKFYIQKLNFFHKEYKMQFFQTKENLANNCCRICLSQEQSDEGFIRPCLCTGTVRYVHEYCLGRWISKQLETKEKQERILCQLCKHPFSYDHYRRFACLPWKRIREQIQENKFDFIVISGSIVIALAFLALILVLGLSNQQALSFEDSNYLRYLPILLLCILSISFLFSVGLLLWTFIIKYEVVVSNISTIQYYLKEKHQAFNL